MKVLVTGGAGFVGSHVVDALAADGDEVVVLDRRSPHHHERRAGVRYMVADARDPESWEIALGGVDAVCHQAARVGLGVDLGDVGVVVVGVGKVLGECLDGLPSVVPGVPQLHVGDYGGAEPGPSGAAEQATDRDHLRPPCVPGSHSGHSGDVQPVQGGTSRGWMRKWSAGSTLIGTMRSSSDTRTQLVVAVRTPPSMYRCSWGSNTWTLWAGW